ncbi:hypothetical protein DBR32_03370 [Taibaiella sp. KBW10]|uniref:DUF262 domain-containing protein n=1 Tax=Taibaiella sp. KBW10 TaxID=2153357 RepID=UPI000F59B32F|nr:DUF262 domain-containing protein [Taibaiella sp. KBW10]RQO32646.1 hypothetical protein DBR32_03370 [Taibaiella sp. KBW10]
METQLYSISKIFTQNIYRIPDYQRGYAWTESQLKDFWLDVEQLENNNNHYLGLLTLELVLPGVYNGWEEDSWIIDYKNFTPYYIVDGQQRLTTVIILIQAILETATDGEKLNYDTIDEVRKKYLFDTRNEGISKSYIFGYEKDNPSYEFLKTRIFNDHSASSYQNEETIYTNNLIAAKEYFIEQIHNMTAHERGILYRKITQNLLFNIYSIKEEIDVFVTFETMNNRGKPLSQLELLKNRLIYLSTKLHCDQTEKNRLRKKINDAWKGVYHYLGKNKNNPLSDDVFLDTHYMLYYFEMAAIAMDEEDHYYMYSRRRNYRLSKNLLDKIFTLKRINSADNNLDLEEINTYVENLHRTVETWYHINNPLESNKINKKEAIVIDKLKRLQFEDIAHLLLLIYLKSSKKTDNYENLLLLEKYYFIESLISYPDNTIHLDTIKVCFDILNNSLTLKEFFQSFKVQIETLINDNSFTQKVISRYSYRGSFYRWTNSRYFFYEYELSIQEKTKSKTHKLEWEMFRFWNEDFVSLEHIYPQKPKSKYWKDRFDHLTLKQRRDLCDSLGNLLALSKPKNSSLQNYDFPKKVQTNKEYVGYKYGSYSEIEVSQSENWTPEDILNRGLKLVNFMEKRWGFSFLNDKERKQFLNIDFI